jgi:hypothetical protein
MLKKIKNWWKGTNNLAETLRLVREKRDLENALQRTTEKYYVLKKLYRLGLPGIHVFEHDPQDTETRQRYVAEVSFFFEAYLQNKIHALIVDVRAQLAQAALNGSPPGMSRSEYDTYLRGTENALWLIHEWAETLSGEHKQNTINNVTQQNGNI